MNVADVLRAARALVEAPETWARCNADLAREECHCALTAISAAFPARTVPAEGDGYLYVLAISAFRRAAGIVGDDSIPDWNDEPGRTHEEVLAAFDSAMALAESEAA